MDDTMTWVAVSIAFVSLVVGLDAESKLKKLEKRVEELEVRREPVSPAAG